MMMDEKNIKIVTFRSDDGVSYGTNFSAMKAENVSSYNDEVIEVRNELIKYPNSVWIGNIDAIGSIFEHDKNPFTCRYMLSCDDNGKTIQILTKS